ncbi:MAG TPA: hypothetical protein VH374_03990 [Polyangia bacterium]|jgi:hypothetical protein|nr:hypothetical protein [Polyangia bacterium]
MATVGCTEPQAGVTAAKYWCHAPATNPLPFLDDMEDGDNTTCTNRADGIVGGWHVRTTASTVTVSTPSGADIVTEADTNDRRSTRAIHLAGTGMGTSTTPAPVISASWAAVGINFGSTPIALSASAVLTFYAKVGAGSGSGGEAARLRVNLITSATPDCDSDPSVPCTNHLSGQVNLTPDWTPFQVAAPFAAEDNSMPAEGDASTVSEIQFRYSFGETARQAPNPDTFDIWIDDVQLTP